MENEEILQEEEESTLVLTDENGVDSLGNRTIESIGEDEELVRYFYASCRNIANIAGKRDSYLRTYEIRGDANDFNNWTLKDTQKIKHPYYDAAGR